MASSPLPWATNTAVFCTLGFFLIATVALSWKGFLKKFDQDAYLSARNTQGPLSLTMSFFASGAGAWVLFTVPESAILGGPIAVLGYAFSTMLPLIIFAFVAPALRAKLPWGITFFEFVQARYGSLVNAYVTLVATFYMFLYLAAEFTSVGDCVSLLTHAGTFDNVALPAIIGTSIVTLFYTTVGGLPVSLATDRVQGIGVCIFTVLVVIAAFGYTLFPDPATGPDPETAHINWRIVTTWGINGTPENAWSMFFVLIIAVTSANLMHTGFQQRIWAAQDSPSVKQGLWAAAFINLPFMFFFGIFGMIAFAHFGFPGLVTGPGGYLAFLSAFFLVQLMPTGWQILAIILAVMMVASSADTIQSGLAGLFSPMVEGLVGACLKPPPEEDAGAHRSRRCVALVINLALTVAINIIAIVLSTQAISVLSLFVFADLVCATCCVPVIMGLSEKVHPHAALAGCLAGLTSFLIIYGIGSPWVPEPGNFEMLWRPGGLYSRTALIAFIVTPLASGLVTLAVALPFYMKGYRFAGFAPPAAKKTEEAAAVSSIEIAKA